MTSTFTPNPLGPRTVAGLFTNDGGKTIIASNALPSGTVVARTSDSAYQLFQYGDNWNADVMVAIGGKIVIEC